MSAVEYAIRQRLVDTTAVAALVASRIYPQIAQQGAQRPYIVYQVISTDRPRHLLATSGLVSNRIQIDSYGVDYMGAKLLADKVRLSLDGLKHRTIGSDGYTAFVYGVALDSERDELDEPFDGDQLGVHRIVQDYIVWSTETVPSN